VNFAVVCKQTAAVNSVHDWLMGWLCMAANFDSRFSRLGGCIRVCLDCAVSFRAQPNKIAEPVQGPPAAHPTARPVLRDERFVIAATPRAEMTVAGCHRRQEPFRHAGHR